MVSTCANITNTALCFIIMFWGQIGKRKKCCKTKTIWNGNEIRLGKHSRFRSLSNRFFFSNTKRDEKNPGKLSQVKALFHEDDKGHDEAKLELQPAFSIIITPAGTNPLAESSWYIHFLINQRLKDGSLPNLIKGNNIPNCLPRLSQNHSIFRG